MSEAWQAPHFVVSMSVDMRRALELRERLLADVPDGGCAGTSRTSSDEAGGGRAHAPSPR